MTPPCKLCELRARKNLGSCEHCRGRSQLREPVQIASVEPAPAETFDPVDVLETSLRQARAVQRRIQEEIDQRGEVDALVKLHAFMSKSINALVPTWQGLRDEKKRGTVTHEEEVDLFLAWLSALPRALQTSVVDRIISDYRRLQAVP